ncbi:basic salivary proline-rich protein 2-like [Myiozetetes cayanensis]|uniref:basic salivary proline-rich protein 2-like n=1 Tax=Myiozetetes cayanensis TaxID=478635 RepID=UPI00215F7F0F|nr:basic salivary proline-rich protein 2-like [Myiozetetes cayanensis]
MAQGGPADTAPDPGGPQGQGATVPKLSDPGGPQGQGTSVPDPGGPQGQGTVVTVPQEVAEPTMMVPEPQVLGVPSPPEQEGPGPPDGTVPKAETPSPGDLALGDPQGQGAVVTSPGGQEVPPEPEVPPGPPGTIVTGPPGDAPGQGTVVTGPPGPGDPQGRGTIVTSVWGQEGPPKSEVLQCPPARPPPGGASFPLGLCPRLRSPSRKGWGRRLKSWARRLRPPPAGGGDPKTEEPEELGDPPWGENCQVGVWEPPPRLPQKPAGIPNLPRDPKTALQPPQN